MQELRLKMLGTWGLGLVLVLLLFIVGDVSHLARLPDLRWESVFFVFLFNLGFTVAHNFRWKKIVEHLSSGGGSFLSFFHSLVNSYAIGKIIPIDVSLVGVRSYYLTRSQKMSISMALFSVLLDRFMDMLMFLTMALPSFLLITKSATAIQSLSILILLVVGQGLLILWKKGETLRYFVSAYRTLVVHGFSKIPILRSRVKDGMEGLEEDYRFSLASVVQIMGWNFVKYLFMSLRFYFTGMALGVPLPWLQSFFFLPFVQLSGLVNVTPAGLGVVELGTYGALFLMGIPKPAILVFVFGQRILLSATFLALFALDHFFRLILGRKDGMSGWNR